ncbi:hypothetical protein [Polaromonas naphthalenivorans]|uniref:Uncharacterized protein n=1 Tax=Polaromonas naphthalenivorans (strain CJ2) TaxID=365044 RepID=A1VV20_POLNA|nr:hypothetical protein [Polaromonas naphthalenivorans]ABM39498.1 hypothetical protein Pnap_4215 [Polaromonas naphthalenivorans CJ2]
MSSEYIYDRAAVRLKGVRFEYIALYILSHSNNVDPYIPNWNLYGFSKLEDALDIPLKYCYYCDDGITRGKKGQMISGEFDINKWRVAIERAPIIKDEFRLQLKFCDEKHSESHPLLKLEKIKAFAVQLDLHLEIESILGHSEAAWLVLDLNNPEHVDLAWATTRDMSDAESNDSYKRLMLPFNFLQRQVAERFFGHLGYCDEKRASATVLRKQSNFDLPETIYKFEFPVDDQPVYKDVRFVVVNWLGRILSCSPDRWFCLKLIELEKKHLGTAESAYIKFKKHMKALQVTSHEGMTIEVMASLSGAQRAEMTQWDMDKRDRLFARLHKPGMSAIFTEVVKDHIQAMALAPYIECNLAISEMKTAKKPQVEQMTFDI